MLLALGLFAFIWGAKLLVIDRFGSDLPFWDQWDREGAHVFPAWFERGELWRPLVTPHNEHRIAPTLATNLGLAVLGGQWDARVQCIVSAAVHAAVLTGLFLWGLRRIALPWALGAGVLIALIGAAPISWENILSGFQSQFYFLAGFSLLAIGGLLTQRALSLRWWLGLSAGILALLSMGSGFLWTVPVLVVAAARLGSETLSRRDTVVTLLAALLILLLGLALHTRVTWHDTLRTTNPAVFLLYAAECLSWPLYHFPWLSLVLWLPWLVIAVSWLSDFRQRKTIGVEDAFLVAAGLWVLLQVAAVSYSRGGSDSLPANRYGDMCGFGLVISALSLARLARRWVEPILPVMLWSLIVTACLAVATHTSWTLLLPQKKADNAAYEQAVQQFVLSEDFETFRQQSLPFPVPEKLAEVLRRPSIREILPASARAPLRVADFSNGNAGLHQPLASRATRTITQPSEWRSAELPVGNGWWKIETIGHLGVAGASLQLVASDDGQVLATISPTRPPGPMWRAAYVRAPTEPARFVARTDRAEHWFAFSEPVEMSALSYRGRSFAKLGWLVLVVGIVGGGVGALARLRQRRHRSQDVDAPDNVLSERSAFSDTRPSSMRFFNGTTLFVTLLASVILVVPFLPAAKPSASVFTIEARVRSEASSGVFQIYYDDGTGLREDHSGRVAVQPGNTSVLQIPISSGIYKMLRIDPFEQSGTITLDSLRILSGTGRVMTELPLNKLEAVQQIASTELQGSALRIVTPPDANDPQLRLELKPPLVVEMTLQDFARGAWRYFLPVFGLMALLLFLVDRAPRTRASIARGIANLALHPARAIAIVAAAAAIASAYPIVFLGKSYVSPNFGTSLLYDDSPTLPGQTAADLVDPKLSDVGAIIWQHVPFSMIQHRALAGGELPLWNRYNATGVPLLAQGQSMFGNPVHFLVILANGASWAWDLKYLIAKWLFAAGLGLTVLALLGQGPRDQRTKGPRDQRTTQPSPDSPLVPWSLGPLVPFGSLVSAALVAATAPFIGFFVYRINHPAFFSVCYAPWPLYFLIRIAESTTRRSLALSCAALLVANLALMNSGTVKEAYMLLLCVNFSGACVILATATPLRDRLVKLLAVLGTGVVFMLITTPIWATFLQTLRNAYTGYNAVSAYQIQPTLLLGFFDEIFYRVLMAEDRVFNPSLNLVLLLGFLYFLATLRQHFTHRPVIALALSSTIPLALAFGFVSPNWIVRIPFLSNVAHVDNTFSCALIVLWTVLAGVGFSAAAQRLGSRNGRDDLVVCGLLLGALVLAWVAFGHSAHRPILGPTFTVNQPGETLTISTFIVRYLGITLVAIVGLAIVAQRAASRRRLSAAAGILLALCLTVLLWRHAMHTEHIGFQNFTVRPPPRANFHASSDAIAAARASHAREPGRGYGIKGNFFPGWTGVYGLETIHGPDALVNPWVRELVGVSGVLRLWDWRLYCEPADAVKARPFFDALNVRFYFDRKSQDPALVENFRSIHRGDLDVYESTTAWPRAFFTDRLDVYDQPAQLIAKFNDANGRPFAAVQQSDLGTSPRLAAISRDVATRTVEPATDYRLTENNTSFRIRAPSAGVIVLTEAYWPNDFIVELNGRRADVVRLNHAFKGVMIDAAGEYHVTFHYWPKNFRRNLILSGIGLALFCVTLVFALRSPRPDPTRRDQPSRVDRQPAAA